MKNTAKIYLKIKTPKTSNFNKFCFFLSKHVSLTMNLLTYFLRMISDAPLVNSRKPNFMLITVLMDLRTELKVYTLYRASSGTSSLTVWYFWPMSRTKPSRAHSVLFPNCWGRPPSLSGCNNSNTVLLFHDTDYLKCSFNATFCSFL